MTLLERSGFDVGRGAAYPRRMADVQIYFAAGVNGQTVTSLISTVTARVGKGARSILLAISSPGGQVFWGVTAYNFLRGVGVEVITHNVGQVDSIAGIVYCAGDRRLCVPTGRFLIHGVSAQFSGTDVSISEKDLRARLAGLEQNRDTIATILASRTGKAVGDVKGDMLGEKIMDAQQATDYGFVTEVTENVFDPTQEIVQIVVP